MVFAGVSPSNWTVEFGMRLRVRESNESRNPVSRNSPVSPSRHVIAVTGSTNEKVADQPELLRMKLAIGPFTGSDGLSGPGAIGGNAATCGSAAGGGEVGGELGPWG